MKIRTQRIAEDGAGRKDGKGNSGVEYQREPWLSVAIRGVPCPSS